MGIFLHPTKLHAARIFAAVRDGWRVLVFEVDAESPSPNAVVVPIPAAGGPTVVHTFDADAFAVSSWDGRRRFFDELEWHFVGPPCARPGGGQAYVSPPGADTPGPDYVPPPTRLYPSYETTLDAVELVGEPAQLAALERSPAPNPALVELLEHRYPGHVLALCHLPAGLARGFVAVRYEPRDENHVFFPLLLVTDGRAAPPRARYEHQLFGQGVVLDQRMLPIVARMKADGIDPLEAPPPPPLPPFVQVDAPIDLAFRNGLLANEDLQAAVAHQ